MDVKYIINYYDSNINTREDLIFYGTENSKRTQMLYFLKKKVGYGYYKRFIRDITIYKDGIYYK